MHLLCTIRQSTDGTRYEFLVRDLSRASITVSNARPVLGSDRTRVAKSLDAFRDSLQGRAYSIEERVAALQRVGDEISSYLLPQPVYRLLSDPSLAGSLLTIETNEHHIPWEVARIEGHWLWERFLVGRQQIFEARREGTPGAWLASAGPSAGGARRMLIVADPEGALPTARAEAEILERLCNAAPGWEAELLLGAEATSGEVIERLQSRAYEILHLACTAVYDAHDPPQSRLFLADEPLPAGRLGDVRFARPPRLVFLNACQAGREEGLLARASGWGRLFLAVGAEAVVGPLWDVRDAAAVRLSEAFYTALLGGATLGNALQDGRRVCAGADDPYLSAHAYVIHGNPALLVASPAEASTEAWVLATRFQLRVTEGPQVGRVIPLVPATMLEGRAIEIDVDQGARLLYSGGAYHFEGKALADGDCMQVGASVIVFEAAPEAPQCELEVRDGPDRGQRFGLSGPLVDVGRGADCPVRLNDPAVSRRHATLRLTDDGWQITGRGSNPTLVNAVPLAGPKLLRDQDEIQLSERTVLRFVAR